MPLPAGYHVELGGQFESAEQAARTLLILGFVVTVGIFLLLFVAFRSARDALLVMLNLPLALIGGVIGRVRLRRRAVGGIDHRLHHPVRHRHPQRRHAGRPHPQPGGARGRADPLEAVRRGAIERLIPILMTALAAGLALIPLALAVGQPGSEIQAPMAIVILFGLLSSTALNMIVVPALYLRFGQIDSRAPKGAELL